MSYFSITETIFKVPSSFVTGCPTLCIRDKVAELYIMVRITILKVTQDDGPNINYNGLGSSRNHVL
jgi:hypothetical protein